MTAQGNVNQPHADGMQDGQWLGPLAGIKVLDLSRVLAGPYTTMLLGDLGAEILKIEPPGTGDDIRVMAPFINGESHYFLAMNRNKKSLVIDLKTPEGVGIFLDLVRKADVVVENYRPGVMDSLGLGYERLTAINPRLVYCSISGFGATGPLREKPSFDIVTQALSGVFSMNGEPGRPPVKLGLPLGDMVGGVYGSLAIVSAIHERSTTGRGRQVDISLLDGMLGMLGYLAQIYFVTGKNPVLTGSKHPNVTPYAAFPASDGFLVVACLNQGFWENFANALGRPDFLQDPRFTNLQARLKHREVLEAEIEAIMIQRSMSEWQEILERFDVPHSPILTVGDALESEHARARNMVVTARHSTAGDIQLVGRPIKYVGAEQAPLTAPPALGEHTRQVLFDELGYSAELLDSLEQTGVINRRG